MRAAYVAIALGALAGCTPAFAGNEFSVSMGKMLNNTNQELPGWVSGIQYAHTRMLWDLSVRASFMKATRSHLSNWGDSTFETVAVAKDYGQWTVGLGSVVYMNYDSTVEWKGRLYGPNDGIKYPSRHCWQCGLVTTVDYRLGKSRFSAELQYYTVRQMVPTYNGGILLLKYDVYRRGQ